MYNRYLSLRDNGGTPKYSLEFFREIFDVFGIEVFSKFNQDYRELGITKSHMDLSNTNRFAEYFSKHAEVDLVPYFLSQNFTIDESVIAANFELPNVFYLPELTYNQEAIDYILQTYNLATKYSLVDSSIFTTDENLKNITGSAIVNIDIDNFGELDGKQVMFKNGSYEYFARIIDGRATFENIPVGEYNLGMPLTNSGLYKNSADSFITVSQDNISEANVEYSIVQDSILNLGYIFNIKSDANYTPFYADLTYISDNNYNLKLGTLADRYNPNQSTDDLYGYFKVFDENGSEVRSYEFYNLTPSVAGSENITVKKGYTFEMYRTGMPQRKYYKNIANSKEYYDKNSDLMKFEITDNGLQYINGTDKTEEVTLTYLDDNINNFSKSSQYVMSNKLVNINNAISKLSPSSQVTYTQMYKDITRTHNPTVKLVNETIETVVGKEPNYLQNIIATDYEDGQVENILIDDSNVDLQNVGTYLVTVTVLDSDHNYSDIEMLVQVNEGENLDEISNTPEITNEDKTVNETIENTVVDKTENEVVEDTIVDNTEIIIIDKVENETIEDTIVDKIENESIVNIPKISEEQADNSEDFLQTVENESNNEATIEKPIKSVVDDNPVSDTSSDVRVATAHYEANKFRNKNKVVPYYIDENGKKKIVKFSSVINNEIVYIKDSQGREYDFEETNNKVYTDIDNSWAKGNIEFVTSREILNSVEPSKFSPNLDVTRAMLVTVLGRLSDVSTTGGYSNNFIDVDINSWYGNYVGWAESNEIVNGVTVDSFSPNSNVTREQLAVIIDHYLTYIGVHIPSSDVTPFVDDSNISSWAKYSVYRLKSIGLVNGDSSGKFNQKNNLTRAELSAILQRLIEYTLTN